MMGFLDQAFFQHALVAGTLVGATCSIVGVYALLKRVVFLGLALAQLASAGVALALLLGWSPLVTALVTSVGGVVAFSQLRWRLRVPMEAALGAAYVVAAALGTVLVALNPVGEARALSVLFGNILSVPRGELTALAVVTVGVLLTHALFRKELVFVAFDRETAAAHGVNARGWDLVLHLTLAVAVAFAIRSAGVLVTFALLVIPALGARAMVEGLGPTFLVAASLGTVSVPLGLVAAFALDLPAGAAVSLTVGALGVAAVAARGMTRVGRRSVVAGVVCVGTVIGAPGQALAQGTEVERELRALREAVTELRRIVGEQQRLIDELRARAPQPAPAAPTVPAPPAVAVPVPAAPPSSVATAPAWPPVEGGPPADTTQVAPARGLPPWIALLPEVRLEGNFIFNATLANRRRLEKQLGEEQAGEEFFTRRNRLNVRELELGLRSAIDPFARFEAIISSEQKFGGDLDFRLEEAILTFGALPGRLEAKVGRFRTGFGEFNESDPEEIPEVTPPNVITNLFGSEGWIDTGIAVNRLFGITDALSLRLTGAIFNGDNETSFNGGAPGVARRPAWVGRAEWFLELAQSVGLEGGVGYADGHTRDDAGRARLRSRIFNAHLQLEYREPLLALYRGVNVLGEFFYTLRDRFHEPTDDELAAGEKRRRQVLDRIGLYVLAEAQIARRWSIGTRFDYSQLPDREEAGPSVRHETAGSLILSFKPSRFLTLRAQYTHTERNFAPGSDEIFLQALFKLGYEHAGPF
jgi:zinc transport system permease protein